jgi:hypothetical protein
MHTRNFALILGIVYTLIGVAGFIPGLLEPAPPGAPDLAVTARYGLLFGLFPVNAVHNLVHLALGIWGLIAYASWDDARRYARSLAIIYAALTVLGVLPRPLSTLFGLAPLFGHDIWLHALTAVVAAYFGWGRRHALIVSEEERARRAA